MPPVVVPVIPLELPSVKPVRKVASPPRADTVTSMLRSLTLDDEYFHRRALRSTCIQPSPLEDFLPEASEIIPGLFVCDLYTATSPSVIARLGITHVASVIRDTPQRYPSPIEHLCIPVDDTKNENLLDYLDSALAWVHAALQGDGRVLIHCMWGMSRSASIAIAYLIMAQCMSLNEALKTARSRRRVVRPNVGFMKQLKMYEKVTRLREKTDQRLVKGPLKSTDEVATTAGQRK
ncbi:Dual specificity protein phosphatase 22 [Grifola frondosa]|uniref:Dual specificity protein phosphatase 22 n=1 Tax=Grifola frondosa TaxID=5627 RepID=A0A1C7LQP8_GRIFR|nr:Dual specificity protein phosphatase 22 [Grifola frondosa]